VFRGAPGSLCDMPERFAIPDEQWAVLAPVIIAATRRGPKGRDDRGFFEAIRWILRTGAPWRDLPLAFGGWSCIYRRFRRWAVAGRWETIRQLFGRASARLSLIDSTIVKAHPHAAGALRQTGGQACEALGRSRGGLTTKIHAVVSERGELLRFVLTAGEVHDVTQATALIRANEGNVIGDRAYDSDAVIAHIEALGLKAIIPSRSHRKVARTLDRAAYRQRNIIERWFGRLKGFRRIATRYDKTLLSYAAFVATAAFLVAVSGWRA
jgi:transposase